MLDWLLRLVGARRASRPFAAATDSRRPPPGQQWIYVVAPDCDVSSIVRSIEGVLKVTRDRNGCWRITADQDVVVLVARNIVSKGGSLTTLITFDALTELNARR